MFWKSKKIKKSSFLLLEVITALTIVSMFMPSVLKDQGLYSLQVSRLEFLNEFENAYREKLFRTFYALHQPSYIDQIKQMDDKPFVIKSGMLKVSGYQSLPYAIILTRRDNEGVNYQLSMVLKVDNLPFGLKTYQNDPQHFYIHK